MRETCHRGLAKGPPARLMALHALIPEMRPKCALESGFICVGVAIRDHPAQALGLRGRDRDSHGRRERVRLAGQAVITQTLNEAARVSKRLPRFVAF
jgi:hypothetical protein